ncbi:LLM class flavin-dependent oxidoreductase [Paenibacillus sp. V4I7]|uniref:LLM class flavin-dependent oxidoreductase n=1 Tax=Paenibacillus sp. V4I7 TaxID=3042307 RepID=UPI002783EF80|nr:LLM class flavin-dependent oxidoreductase [Paenibacillus sp. V4I7]MDQ0901293.1 luciferase family oxidoreductase group 1 [Paenibacillus sp. V4I7]
MISTMNGQNIKLSVLDFVHVYKYSNPTESLQNTTEVVKLADQLGYTRYWFTEHHNTTSQISTSPELLSLHAASQSQHIRVGSGGIMLPNHSPLKVVENFTLLEALHPGRVDLGLGRASGTDRLTATALQVSGDDFSVQLNDLLSFFSRNFPENHPYRRIKPPGDPTLMPELYMLGSSQGGVQFAIERGLGFAFAAHLAPKLAVPILRAYRENFVPSSYLEEPTSILTIAVITAETDEEARYLSGPLELMWARMATGSANISFPTLEEAASHVYTPDEERVREYNAERFVIGSIENVAKRLREKANAAWVDEIMIADFYPEQAARLKALELLAREFGLNRIEKKNGK